MSNRLDWAATICGVVFLVVAAGILAVSQYDIATGTNVAGKVVSIHCPGGTNCIPTIEFTSPDGALHHVNGPSGGNATTFEVGDEWTEVLIPNGDPSGAFVRNDPHMGKALAVLLAILGAALLGVGWAGLVELPEAEESGLMAWWIAGALGVVGGTVALALNWTYLRGETFVPMALITAAAGGSALGRVGHRTGRGWVARLSAVMFFIAVGFGLSLVVPVPWRDALLASAPLAVAISLPAQSRLWPSIDLALADRGERAAKRERLQRALVRHDPPEEMIVRVDAVEDSVARLTWRHERGEETLRTSSPLLARVQSTGPWYLIVAPRIEQRPVPTTSDYRTTALEPWLTHLSVASDLGADLDRALRVEPRAPLSVTTWLVPFVLWAVVLLGVGALLRDRWPALSGAPIPPTGLVERLDAQVVRTGRVEEVAGWPSVKTDAPCTVTLEPAHGSGQTCHVSVVCGTSDLYPGEGQGYTRCLSSASGAIVGEDTNLMDGDPAIRVDTRVKKVIVRAHGVSDQRVTIALD